MLKVPSREKVRRVMEIALPSITEQFLMVFVGMVSVAVIGQLGKNEMVASAMTNQLVNWLQGLYVGLATGGSVVIARMWGDGDREKVRQGFMQNLLLTTLISLVVLALSIVYQNQILHTFFGKADPFVLEQVRIYFGYSMVGMPAVAVMSVINGSIRGVGDTRAPLYSTIVLNVINVILSVSFIHGIPAFGIPSLGIAGAGIAVVAARYIAAVFTVVLAIVRKSPILPARLGVSRDRRIVLRILRVGLPSALEQLVFQGGFVIQQTILIGFGTAFQGGYQIGSNLNGLINAPTAGLGIAITVLISQTLGRREMDEADELVRISRFFALGGFVVVGILLFSFAPLITRIFTPDAEVVAAGTFFTRLFGLLAVPLAYFQAMAGVLRGSGDVKYVAVTSVAGLWAMRIGSVLLLAHLTKNGYLAVAFGISADFLLRSFLYHIRVKKGDWKYIRV